jgi:hypothetical protein
MTTRILSSRALRLVLALVIVGLLVASRAMFVPSIALVGFALAWLLVPGDRRWFVPASLLVVAAGFFLLFFGTVRYPLGDGSEIMVHRLTGAVDILPPNRVRTNPLHEWNRLHPGRGWVRLKPSRRPSLFASLGIRRPKPEQPASDSVAVGIPPVPSELAAKGGCLNLSGGRWVPCPDIEYLPPIWPGQTVISKDTIAVDRLPDGRCHWESLTLKVPTDLGLLATIGERHPKTCRAVVYNVDKTPGWRAQ